MVMVPQSDRLDLSRPILVLAPHLRYPTRNGADIYADRLANALSLHVPAVDILAESSFVRYEEGKETRREIFPNSYFGKRTAAFFTVIRRSHFYREKFVTSAYAKEARKLLAKPEYGSIVYSFTASATVAEEYSSDKTHILLTHHNEFRWFEEVARVSRNPAVGLVARSSVAWTRRFLNTHGSLFRLVHTTAADAEGYEVEMSGLKQAVAPIGVDLPFRPAPPLKPQSDEMTLLFVGALSVGTNEAAIQYFLQKFWPPLRRAFGFHLKVVVAGSTPSGRVKRICQTPGWEIWANVPEHVLEDLLMHSTFTILPHRQQTGAKMMLLKSLAFGVPVLATPVAESQSQFIVSPGLQSDSAEEWTARAREVADSGIDSSVRNTLRAVAEEHTWVRSAEFLVEQLTRLSSRPKFGPNPRIK